MSGPADTIPEDPNSTAVALTGPCPLQSFSCTGGVIATKECTTDTHLSQNSRPIRAVGQLASLSILSKSMLYVKLIVKEICFDMRESFGGT